MAPVTVFLPFSCFPDDPRVRLAEHDANAVPSLRRPQRAPETRVLISPESIPAVDGKRRPGTTSQRVRRVARRRQAS